jgi:hypothetical protein
MNDVGRTPLMVILDFTTQNMSLTNIRKLDHSHSLISNYAEDL